MMISCLDYYDSPLTGLYDLSLASSWQFLLQQLKGLLKYMSNNAPVASCTEKVPVPVQFHPSTLHGFQPL